MVETERRFLLKCIPDIKWDDTLKISQHYLTDKNDDRTERIRGIMGVTKEDSKFFHTVKTRISDMSAEEVEKEITFDEYSKLVKDSKRTIHKTRYVKRHPKNPTLKWEVDEFSNPMRLIIAEIELPDEDYELLAPDWINDQYLMEITGEHQFSNSNLAS